MTHAAVQPEDAEAGLLEPRQTIHVSGLPRKPNMRSWLHRLSDTRPDILVEESLMDFAEASEDPRSWAGTVTFRIVDLLMPADLMEVYEHLQHDEPAELWHALTFLERQRWGDDGDLAESSENLFHLAGSTLLIIEGLPRRKAWKVRLTDTGSYHEDLDPYTRFFRCVTVRHLP